MVEKTLKAIPVIEKVRGEREKDLWKVRMRVREKEVRKDALRELAGGMDVIRPIIVREKLREREEKEKDMEVVEEVVGE